MLKTDQQCCVVCVEKCVLRCVFFMVVGSKRVKDKKDSGWWTKSCEGRVRKLGVDGLRMAEQCHVESISPHMKSKSTQSEENDEDDIGGVKKEDDVIVALDEGQAPIYIGNDEDAISQVKKESEAKLDMHQH